MCNSCYGNSTQHCIFEKGSVAMATPHCTTSVHMQATSAWVVWHETRSRSTRHPIGSRMPYR